MTKHTSVSGGIVIGRSGKVLVVNQNGNSWSLPKGHVEPGETARQAAEREIAEESGVKSVVYLADLGTYQRYRIGLTNQDDPSELKTIEMFLYKTDQEDLQPQDESNPEARWVVIEEVASLLTHPKDKEFFQNHIKQVTQYATTAA